MSGYYAKNPHAAPTDLSEQRERLERCEQEAGKHFAAATKTQTAAYNLAMSDLRGLTGSRYERAREAAKAAWEASTADASAAYHASLQDLMLTGEISEASWALWDQIDVAAVMEVA